MELNLRTLGILGNWEIRVREHSLERQHGKGQRRTETIYTKAIPLPNSGKLNKIKIKQEVKQEKRDTGGTEGHKTQQETNRK